MRLVLPEKESVKELTLNQTLTYILKQIISLTRAERNTTSNNNKTTILHQKH